MYKFCDYMTMSSFNYKVYHHKLVFLIWPLCNDAPLSTFYRHHCLGYQKSALCRQMTQKIFLAVILNNIELTKNSLSKILIVLYRTLNRSLLACSRSEKFAFVLACSSKQSFFVHQCSLEVQIRIRYQEILAEHLYVKYQFPENQLICSHFMFFCCYQRCAF